MRKRIELAIDDLALALELDRLIYEIEVEAQVQWLRTLMAFDAYCARRDAAGGGRAGRPVR